MLSMRCIRGGVRVLDKMKSTYSATILKQKQPSTNRRIRESVSALNILEFSLDNQDTKKFSTSNKFSESKALTIFSQISKVKSSPVPALVLGLSGLIPFMAAPGYLVLQQLYCTQISFAQLAYGASILSFLGGVRWGISLHEDGPVKPDWKNLGYSVMPSLVAWLALLTPEPAAQIIVIVGLGGAAYIDTAWRGYPDWFKGLRFILSFVAILSLWTTLMCKYLIKSDRKPINDQEKKKAI